MKNGDILGKEKSSDYIKKGINDLELPQRICKFFSANAEIKQVGQGNITIICSKLWGMTEEEFEETFGVKLKEVQDE